MDTLWTGITSSIEKIVPLIGTVTTGLLSNELFQVIIGIVIFAIILGVIFSLINLMKKRNIRNYRKVIRHDGYIGSENWTDKQVIEVAKLNNYWRR